MEGFHCYNAATCDQTGLTLPVAEYGHDLGCAVIGGVVVRDGTGTGLDGRYLYGDDCSGRIRAIDPSKDGPQIGRESIETGKTISAIAEDDAGSVYVLDLGSGGVFQLAVKPG